MKKVTRHWFDSWSNEYDQTLGSIGFHTAVLDLIVEHSKVRDCDRVLDIGCGTGLLSLKFLEAQNCLLTSIDNSKEMAAIFKEKIKKLKLGKKIDCVMMDADSIKFKNNTFDIAASSFVLHHLKDKVKPLRRVFRALKPGGRFIIGEIDMDTTGSHEDIPRLKRIVKTLEEEWIWALKDAGVQALLKMYDNGRKHFLNQGEYCVSLKQWVNICRSAGFKGIVIKRPAGYKCFGIVIAKKPRRDDEG